MLMLLGVTTMATGGVDGAGFPARVEAGAGCESGDEDDAAIDTEQLGQAWMKRGMGEGHVADSNELSGEGSGVDGVGGEVGQGLLP